MRFVVKLGGAALEDKKILHASGKAIADARAIEAVRDVQPLRSLRGDPTDVREHDQPHRPVGRLTKRHAGSARRPETVSLGAAGPAGAGRCRKEARRLWLAER